MPACRLSRNREKKANWFIICFFLSLAHENGFVCVYVFGVDLSEYMAHALLLKRKYWTTWFFTERAA